VIKFITVLHFTGIEIDEGKINFSNPFAIQLLMTVFLSIPKSSPDY